MRLNALSRGRSFASSVLCALLLLTAPAHAEAPVEYRLKAAFMYNFTRFIEWPQPLESGRRYMDLCILGDNPFGSSLDAISGKQIRDKSLRLREHSEPGELDGCQLVFISRSEEAHLLDILARLADMPVLSVSEIDNFSHRGGIIHLMVVNNKVQFSINLDAAERAGLHISSKLLNLANIVHDTDDKGR